MKPAMLFSKELSPPADSELTRKPYQATERRASEVAVAGLAAIMRRSPASEPRGPAAVSAAAVAWVTTFTCPGNTETSPEGGAIVTTSFATAAARHPAASSPTTTAKSGWPTIPAATSFTNTRPELTGAANSSTLDPSQGGRGAAGPVHSLDMVAALASSASEAVAGASDPRAPRKAVAVTRHTLTVEGGAEAGSKMRCQLMVTAPAGFTMRTLTPPNR